MERIVYAGEEKIIYQLLQKKVKNISFRVYSDLRVVVTASPKVAPEIVDSYVLKKANWIIKTQKSLAQKQAEKERFRFNDDIRDGGHIYLLGEKIALKIDTQKAGYYTGQVLYLAEGDEAALHKQLAHFYHQQSIILFEACNQEVSAIFASMGVEKATVSTRKMSASWGRCHVTKRHIVLNTQLVRAPKECIFSVMVHEYVHFLYPNHSKAFKDCLRQLLPEYDRFTEKLNLCIGL